MIDVDVVNDLARAYKAGDTSALAELHHALEAVIKANIRRASIFTLPPTLSTDDLRQESWLLLARVANAWPGGSSFLAYFSVALGHAFARWSMYEDGCDARGRHRCRSVDHDTLVETIDRHVIRWGEPEQAVIVTEMLAVLPLDERRAVVMHELDECTFEQIGAELGISRAAAYRRCTAGLERLGATIGGEL